MAAATATAEVCNANSHMITSGELRALQPVFRTYGGRKTTRSMNEYKTEENLRCQELSADQMEWTLRNWGL
ncbi:hypothetical protein ZWY2020_018740 [Hordeum vulgare]|nr:hypothetical protein ZWY2020_018740 [Hordeum vulgare]